MHAGIAAGFGIVVLLVASASSVSAAELTVSLQTLDSIGPLFIGESTETDVIKLLGEPEEKQREETPPRPPYWPTARELLKLKYPSRGIEITLNLSNAGRMSAFEVSSPFVSAPNDRIRIGMPLAEARSILEERFGPIDDSVFWQSSISFFYVGIRHSLRVEADGNRLIKRISLFGDRKLTAEQVRSAEADIAHWKSPTPAELRLKGVNDRDRKMIVSYKQYESTWEQFRADGWGTKVPRAGELMVSRIEGSPSGVLTIGLEVAKADGVRILQIEPPAYAASLELCTLVFRSGKLTENSCRDRPLRRGAPIAH